MNSLGWALRCCSGWHLDRTQSSDIRRRCTIGLEIGRAQSELQSRLHLVCRLLLEKKKTNRHMQLQPPIPPFYFSICDGRVTVTVLALHPRSTVVDTMPRISHLAHMNVNADLYHL